MSTPAPLRLWPQLTELPRLVAYIDALNLSPARANAFQLAAEELFVNTVTHSEPPASFILFAFSNAAGHAIATYTDDGSAFDPTQLAAPDTTLPAGLRAIGGLGIHFIRSAMPVFLYRRHDRCNITTFGYDFA